MEDIESIKVKMISVSSGWAQLFVEAIAVSRNRWGQLLSEELGTDERMCGLNISKPLPYLWPNSAIIAIVLMTCPKIRYPIYDF